MLEISYTLMIAKSAPEQKKPTVMFKRDIPYVFNVKIFFPILKNTS